MIRDRVLVVAERPALPAYDGARRRLVSLLRALEGYKVDYIHFTQPGDSSVPVESEMPHCRTIGTVPHDNRRSMMGRMTSMLSVKPYGALRNRSVQMDAALRGLPVRPYDAVIICGINMAQYRTAIGVDRAILDLCDSELRHCDVRYKFVSDPFRKVYFAWNRFQTLNELSVASKCFDAWTVIADREATSLWSNFPDITIHVVANSLPDWTSENSKAQEGLVVLTGNFDYYPNVDAAIHCATEIMPLLRRAHPGCRLRIIGSHPPTVVRELAKSDIEVTGFVADLPRAVSEGSVFICPLRVGTGIKNKVIEAMYLGIAVVSSAVGIEGIAAGPGVHYLEANSPKEFADTVGRLLQDATLRTRLARNARELVTARFGPEVPRRQLSGILTRLGLTPRQDGAASAA